MTMLQGEQWRCIDRNCGCEILVVKAPQLAGTPGPTCCCGRPMKKPYLPPRFRAITEPDEMKRLQDRFFSSVGERF